MASLNDEMFPRHFVVRGPEKSPYEGRREYFHLNENLKSFLYIIGLLFALISSFFVINVVFDVHLRWLLSWQIVIPPRLSF